MFGIGRPERKDASRTQAGGKRRDCIDAVESGTGIVDEMGRRVIDIDDDRIVTGAGGFAEPVWCSGVGEEIALKQAAKRVAGYRLAQTQLVLFVPFDEDRESTRMNSSHQCESRMPAHAINKKKTHY